MYFVELDLLTKEKLVINFGTGNRVHTQAEGKSMKYQEKLCQSILGDSEKKYDLMQDIVCEIHFFFYQSNICGSARVACADRAHPRCLRETFCLWFLSCESCVRPIFKIIPFSNIMTLQHSVGVNTLHAVLIP